MFSLCSLYQLEFFLGTGSDETEADQPLDKLGSLELITAEALESNNLVFKDAVDE